MERTINKINDDIIEIVETVSTTKSEQHNKNVLLEDKRKLNEKIIEIDKILKEF